MISKNWRNSGKNFSSNFLSSYALPIQRGNFEGEKFLSEFFDFVSEERNAMEGDFFLNFNQFF